MWPPWSPGWPCSSKPPTSRTLSLTLPERWLLRSWRIEANLRRRNGGCGMNQFFRFSRSLNLEFEFLNHVFNVYAVHDVVETKVVTTTLRAVAFSINLPIWMLSHAYICTCSAFLVLWFTIFHHDYVLGCDQQTGQNGLSERVSSWRIWAIILIVSLSWHLSTYQSTMITSNIARFLILL